MISRKPNYDLIFVIITMLLIGISSKANADPPPGTTTLSLIHKFRTTLVGSSHPQEPLIMARVPAIGCPQDGQEEPLVAPTLPASVSVLVPQELASLVGYYSADEDLASGVLAPKGWDCFGTYGSDGSSLYVVPGWLGVPIRDRLDKLKEGPVVIKKVNFGDTSGRFAVAKISARIFPSARAFVERVRAEGLDDPKEYMFAPWPADKLNRLSEFGASYVTPSGAQGLGTAFGLASSREPISGLIFLTGSDGAAYGPLLHILAVRLPPADQALYEAIAVANIASLDSLLGDQKTPEVLASASRPSAGTQNKFPALGIVRIEGIPRAFEIGVSNQLWGCRDPVDTLRWLSIVTGQLYEREVRDGTRRIQLHATERDVYDGLEGTMLPLISKGRCGTYSNGKAVGIKAAGVWGGKDMLCLESPFVGLKDTCFWVPALAIDHTAIPPGK